MNMALVFASLVTLAVLEGVRGFPEQHLIKQNGIEDNDILRSMETFVDDEDGLPISPEEIAESLTNSNTTAEPEEGVDAIEHSGQYQGDILLTPEQKVEVEMGRSATTKSNLWPNGVIPYTIWSGYTSAQRQVIARAMSEYQQKTCIRFVGRTTQKDYIHITSRSGCSSYIGYIGGRQEVSLKVPGCLYLGIVIHEFMHASGFHHEQSRSDRDSFVTIYFQNILKGMEFNFEKKSTSITSNQGLAYDFNSVMHYPAKAFSKNGQITIGVKKAGATIGQRKGFSELDVLGLKMLYKCGGTDCINKNVNCQDWADQGECNNPEYEDFMEDKCAKACGTCGDNDKSKLIPLSTSNIIKHGGFTSGGSGPQNLLVQAGYWNPNPKPWYVTFNFGKTYKVTKVVIINQGDTTHDVKSMTIESSTDNSNWTPAKVVNNVAAGHKKPQYFTVSDEAQYWRMTVKTTASGFQPWVRYLGFYGSVVCKDKHKNCADWSKAGYCTGEYEEYMQENCGKSCKKC